MVPKKKLVVILMGPPGAGKGTQATLLAERLNLHYLETSRVLEEKFAEKKKKGQYIVVDGKKYFFMKERKNWETGLLCSPPFVTHLIQQEIRQLSKEKKNLVLAGSPRTLYEAKKVTPLLEKLYGKKNIKIIFIALSLKESIFRNSHRRICELMRHPILYNKETKNLRYCPLDGSLLIKRRKLDDPKTIKIRWSEYKERTLPVLEYFSSRNLIIQRVNGERSVAKVFYSILQKIDDNS